MLIIYKIFIRVYRIGITLASLFSKKAGLWINGRKGLFEKMEAEMPRDEKRMWIHCSSLGEFEQSRPFIEEFRKRYPETKVVLTFFSPSGYETRKNYDQSEYIYYLPTDFRKNVRRFIRIVNPSLAVFVKYDVWYHYVDELSKNHVPLFLVSANFRPGQVYFRWYGRFFVRILEKFSHIFVQNESSAFLLKSVGLQNYSQAGDIRFDRVADTAKQAKKLPLLAAFSGFSPVFIAGSTWPKGEEIIVSYINNMPDGSGLKFIIAPHDVKAGNISRIYDSIQKPVVRYSDLNEENAQNARVLLIDNVGLLASAYKYGIIAYVGGGFSGNLHNVLEATTFGLPVFTGPKHSKFPEVADMVQLGIVQTITGKEEFKQKLDYLLSNGQELKKLNEKSKLFIEERKGATLVIFTRIAKHYK